jgi:hypothetical protein
VSSRLEQETRETRGGHVVEFFKLLPRTVTVIVVVFVLVYVSVLTSVAIVTERSVEFLPPRIGEGPKSRIVSQLGDLRSDLRQVSELHSKQITFLREKLAEARNRSAELDFGSSTQSMNAIRYQSEINELDNQFLKRLTEFQTTIEQVRVACQ